MDLGALTSALVIAFLIVTMIAIGLRLPGTPEAPLALVPPLVRLAAVSLVMLPVIGIVLVRLFALDAPVALALLALAAAPAGTVGPKLVHLAGGNLALAILASFSLSAIATLSVAPTLTVAATATGILSLAQGIDAGAIVGRLVLFQLLPLTIGLAIARARPRAVEGLADPLTRLSTILLIVFIVVVVVDGWRVLIGLDPRALVAAFLLVAAADILGWFAGGPTPAGRRSGVLISGQRSSALALLVVGGPGAPIITAALVAMGLVILAVNAIVATGMTRAVDVRSLRVRPSA